MSDPESTNFQKRQNQDIGCAVQWAASPAVRWGKRNKPMSEAKPIQLNRLYMKDEEGRLYDYGEDLDVSTELPGTIQRVGE